MKNIYQSIVLILSISLILFSCNNEDESNGIEVNSDLILLEPTVSNVIINYDTPNAEAINITWDDNAGASAPYAVEGSTLSDFSNVVVLGTTDQYYFNISMGELNTVMNSLGASPYAGTQLYVRIRSGEEISNEVVYNITTYPEGMPEITNPSSGANFTLDESAAGDLATQVEWTYFDNTISGVLINYVVEAAAAGTNFASPVTVGTVGSTSVSQNMLELSVGELNGLALAVGIAPGEAGQIDLRVKSTIETASGSELAATSDVVTITVAPYSIDYPNLYLVGDATAPGWNPNNSNPALYRDSSDPSIFKYTGYFNQGSFKLLEVLGQWQPQWGTNDGTTLAVNDGTSSDPGTFNVPAAGYYTYTFDFAGNTGTFSSTSYDADGAATYATIGLIGNAPPGQAWTDDYALTQSTFDVHQWSATSVPLVVGEFKFRANNSWDVNWGSGTGLYGTGTPGGPNMQITEAGSYDVYFNDLTGDYVLVLN